MVAWMTSSRSPGHDEQAARADALDDVARLHRADRHVLDDAGPGRRPGGAPRPASARRASTASGWTGCGRYGSVPSSSMPWRARPSRRTSRAGWVRRRASTLLTTAPSDLDAVPREQRMVEHDLVDRPADAGLGDDDRAGPEHRRDVGVREADDRPDAGVPGALDQQHVAVRGEPSRRRRGCARRGRR